MKHGDYSARVAALFGEYASVYAEKYANVQHYLPVYQPFMEMIPAGGIVLEVGCGPGNVTSVLRKLRSDVNITATDFAPEMLELAKKQNPEVRFFQLDCRDLARINEKFDGILAGFVFPYLDCLEVEIFLKQSYQNLHSGGLLCITTMEGKAETSGYQTSSDGKHSLWIHIHESQTLQLQAEKAGFQVLKAEVTETESHGKKVQDLMLLLQKN